MKKTMSVVLFLAVAFCTLAANAQQSDKSIILTPQISAPAFTLINTRTSQNQSQFFVYQDMDSGFNHGFPSGLWGNNLSKLHTDPGCVYSAVAANGCSTDPTSLDQTRGTVFRVTFD